MCMCTCECAHLCACVLVQMYEPLLVSGDKGTVCRNEFSSSTRD